MTESITSVGIIGLGSFGMLAKSLVPDSVETVTYRRTDSINQLKKVGQCDVVVLAISLQDYDVLLPELAPLLAPTSLLVDVCSVKIEPANKIARLLPHHQSVLLTHPLFGPESFNDGRQHTLIVTGKTNEKANKVLSFCQDTLELKVLHMTNEEHDRRMADVHALTFFLARGLSKMSLMKEPFMTPSFQSILDLIALDSSQSEALFQTIENGNPYARAERENLLRVLNETHNNIQNKRA